MHNPLRKNNFLENGLLRAHNIYLSVNSLLNQASALVDTGITEKLNDFPVCWKIFKNNLHGNLPV